MSSSSGTSAITRVSMRSLAAHKVRFVLTILSVVLGTAFIAGSFMFTNSLSRTFDGLFSDIYDDVGAVVEPQPGQPPLPPQFVDEVGAQPGVDKVNIADETQAVFATKDGTVIRTGGAPSVIRAYYPEDQTVGLQAPIVEGQAPTTPTDMILNRAAAEKFNVHPGDTLTAVDAMNRRDFTVTGIYDFSAAAGGYVGGMVTPATYVQDFGATGLAKGVYVDAKPGVSSQQLVAELRQAYPNLRVRTGQELADESTAKVEDSLGFLNYFLVAFGLIALLVGAFIIANTFSMIVAQRTREFALLRALGTSRRQLTSSVVVESIVIGIIGSLLGVLAGVGLVHAIYAAMDAFGFGLPSSGVSLTVKAVVAPLIVGVLVTVASAWAPARRAGRVRPVEAMRSGDQSSSSSLVKRTVAGGVAFLIGVVAMVVAISLSDAATSTRAITLGVGAALMILGTFLFSPALGRPVVPALGRVLGAPFGAVGKLAATNSQRNPRRTATTAFALTLGLTLVACFGMLGATMKQSVTDIVSSSVKSDLVITGPQQSFFPLPDQLITDVEKAPGVASTVEFGVTPLAIGPIANGGGPGGEFGAGYARGDISSAMAFTMAQGTADFTQPGFIADKDVAAANGWTVGSTVQASIPNSPFSFPVTLMGTYDPTPALGPFVVSWPTLEPLVQEGQPLAGGNGVRTLMVMVTGNGSQSVRSLQDELNKVTEPFVIAQVQTPTEYAGQQAVLVDQMLNILYSLLALAIIVAVLGIINTLALNVIERRQELGMLRAVGMHRRQIRRMITLEAVQIAVFGAIIGAVLGVVLGFAFVEVLSNEGLGPAVVPWTLIVVMLLASAVVGAVAAIWPAIKAARTPPLEAIAD